MCIERGQMSPNNVQNDSQLESLLILIRTFFDFFKHHRITGRPFIIVKLWFLVTTTFPSSSQPHLEVCVRVGVPISTIEVKHHLAAAPATHSKVSSKAFFVDDKKNRSTTRPRWPRHHNSKSPLTLEAFFRPSASAMLFFNCTFSSACKSYGGGVSRPRFSTTGKTNQFTLMGVPLVGLCLSPRLQIVLCVWNTSASLTLRRNEGHFAKNDDGNLRILRRSEPWLPKLDIWSLLWFFLRFRMIGSDIS